MQWLVTVRWAGNLQDIPLSGSVSDYKQIETGLVVISILCERENVARQVNDVVGYRCGGVTIEPHIEEISR